MAVGAAVNAAATVPRPVGISAAQELQMLQSEEVANASDGSGRRQELLGLKLSQLQKLASSLGVPTEQVGPHER